MPNYDEDAIVKRIRSLCQRDDKKITAYQIAKNSKMNPSTLNNILCGRFKDIRFSTIISICNGLNITIKDFFDDNLFK